MIDNLIILSLGGIGVCAVFLIFEAIAKHFDWE